MNKGLDVYRQRRDFRVTPEPEGTAEPRTEGFTFVVQKHAARRAHYDLRLELGGVLKSWALPKGPTLDPNERRLAVHVEDHPVEYGAFEGVIPSGEYGGGTVLIWDRGRWTPVGDPDEGYRRGKLKFLLYGERLRGGFTLVRLRGGDGDGRDWLLIKERDAEARIGSGDAIQDEVSSVATGRTLDEVAVDRDAVWHSGEGTAPRGPDPSAVPGARRGPLPDPLSPQLATLVERPPEGDRWLHEIKLDGYRALCRIAGGGPRLFTRSGQDWTERFERIARACAALPVSEAVLDGEVVVFEASGRTSFEGLQDALSRRRGELHYVVFDLLYLDGWDLTRAPLEARKAALRALLDSLGPERPGALRFCDHVTGSGAAFFSEVCRLGLEGVVSKRRDRPYRPGRSTEWRKAKCTMRQELAIGGWTDPRGTRMGFGALLLGVVDDQGQLVYSGRVGTGFDDRALAALHRRLTQLAQREPPFINPPRGKGLHWVRPELVAEVAFAEWTSDGVLRQPVFLGLREDKPAAEVPRERTGPPRIAGVRLTHPRKVLWPAMGITKADLARYYEAVAGRVLAEIGHRPLTLVRCPDGEGAPCFYQKHAGAGVPHAVRRVPIREDDGTTAEYLAVDDLAGLVSLVQMGVLELHPWSCRADRLDRPDRLIVDLDPDPAVPWERVVLAAHEVRGLLAAIGLRSFARTTGGKGLHLVVPLARRQGWDEVKGFAQSLALAVARARPDLYLATASKALRRGKIYIDWLRNARGATAIASWSPRARPGAPVATPVAWDELTAALRPADFTVATVPRRLLAPDPWAGFHTLRQSITARMKRDLGS